MNKFLLDFCLHTLCFFCFINWADEIIDQRSSRQISHGHPVRLCCCISVFVPRPLHAPKHIPSNSTHKNTQTKRRPSPRPARDITTRRPSWELGLLFLLPDNLSAHLSQSNDTAVCPRTYITLAGCHTKKSVSRLMPGLCFSLNFLHIFTVKTWG